MLAMIALLACLDSVGNNQRALWSDPGRVETIDFTYGAGGPALAPQPPFQFLREDMTGTSPKVIARDAGGVEWRIKGGLEVRAEAFVTRFVAALGYFAETTYFVANGTIQGVGALSRAAGFVQRDGKFTYASFERRSPKTRFLDERWTWLDSPFAGTPQLNGLKILVMLVSNWDNKDGRDHYRGSNTSVMACGEGGATQRVYFVNDWGQTLGRWGYGGVFSRHSVWKCADFAAQTSSFITGVSGKYVRFGYHGQHTDDFKNRLTVEDVKWLMQYLGRITDAQIRAGLLASGATADEEECFTRSLRERIEQLRNVATRYSK
jgi:hypothetical protein